MAIEIREELYHHLIDTSLQQRQTEKKQLESLQWTSPSPATLDSIPIWPASRENSLNWDSTFSSARLSPKENATLDPTLYGLKQTSRRLLWSLKNPTVCQNQTYQL